MGWMTGVGIVIDVIREVVDRVLMRPGTIYLTQAEIYAKDRTFVNSKAIIVICVLSPTIVGTLIVGAIYSFGAPLNGDHLGWPYKFIADYAPDLSPVIKIARNWSKSLDNQDFGVRSAVIRSFICLVSIISFLGMTLGVVVAARPFAMYQTNWARKKGAASFSDQSSIIFLYAFFILVLLIPFAQFNYGSALNCVDNSKSISAICQHNSGFFLGYSVVYALSIVICTGLQSCIESGCYEYALSHPFIAPEQTTG